MNNIFIGLILTSFNFTFNFNGHILGLIPDFLGFYFIMKGTGELICYSPNFTRASNFSMVLMIYSAVVYAMDLFAIGNIIPAIRWIMFLPSLAFAVLAMYMMYLVIVGIYDIQSQCNVDLGAKELKKYWTVKAALTVSCTFLSLFPLVAIFAVIALAVFNILFVIKFYNTKKLYEELCKNEVNENSENQIF